MTRQNYYDYEFGETARYIDDASQKVAQLANRLYDAVYSFDGYISIDGMSEDDVLLAIDLMRYDHQEIFYLESANTETNDGKLTGIVLKYRYDANQVPSMRADYERSVSDALSWTSDEYSEIENANALHDYIVLHTAYGYHGDIAFGDESHTAYACLVDNLAICDGYAKAYTDLLSRIDIRSVVVTSESANHAWNIVEIDGKHYHVDTCWDDPIISGTLRNKWATSGYVQQTYFLKSDAYFDANRYGGWLSDIVCDDTSYDNRRDFTTFSGESHSTCGFSDVSSTDWYVMSGTLETVIEKGIMHDYSDGRLGDSDVITRKQLAQMLLNATGDDANGYVDENETGMADVADGQWYTAAANWAVRNGVICGYGDSSRFGVGDAVTSQDLVVMLDRMADGAISTDADGTIVTVEMNYIDFDVTAGYARDVMKQAIGNELLQGSSMRLRPSDVRTRAEATAIILGYI